MVVMKKSRAIELLGGTASSVASAVGVTAQAVSQWPDELPKRIEDRVLAALARKHLPAGLIDGSVAAEETRVQFHPGMVDLREGEVTNFGALHGDAEVRQP